MLARAAQRRSRSRRDGSRQIAAAFNQLHLPWLCPAQLRWIASSPRVSPAQPLESLRNKEARPVASHSVSRSLATVQVVPRYDPPIFLTSAPNRLSSAYTSSRHSEIQPFDPSDLIVFQNSATAPPPTLQKVNGIGGDSTELHQNLHACLSVGRTDRAAAIVRRLAQLFNSVSPELVEAHNVYLRGLTSALVAGRLDAHDCLKRIRYWFEVEIRNKNVPVTGATLAIMCRATMAALPEEARVRTIRRYLHLAAELDLLEETLSSTELDDEEWQALVDLRDLVFPESAIEATSAGFANAEAAAASESTTPTVETEASPQVSPRHWLKVNSVTQKGIGLKSLHGSLASIYNVDATPYPHHLEGTKEWKDKVWAQMQQEKLEEDVVDVAIARWREENENMQKMGIQTGLNGKPMEALLWQWSTTLEKAIREELEETAKALKGETKQGDPRIECGPYLESVKPDKMAAITILCTVQAVMSAAKEGTKLAFLSLKIGSHLEMEVAHAGQSPNAIAAWRKEADMKRKTILKGLARRTNENGEEINKEEHIWGHRGNHESWPAHIKIQIGALLISKFIDVATIPVDGPKGKAQTLEMAFKHGLEHSKGKLVGKIRAHDKLIERLSIEPQRSYVGLTGQMPMLVEPKPWVDFREGCYYRYSPVLMRQKDNDHVQEMYTKAAIEKGDLKQVFNGLDVLGKTAWRINNDVLKVMLDAWNSGDPIAKIPGERPDATLPQEPDASEGPAARRAWKREVRKIENEIGGMHSNRCFTNLQLEVARAYADKTFYYPHNIDFRGRAYPVPPFLNHMGADNARGLLIFGKGKALGAVGLRWLKIHLSNLYGFDKASLDEREQFTMDHMDDIFDSATNPLDGKKWWLTAGDPWQCLAACFEVKAAMESPDPAQFVSHIPVAQDGSCNGLQHYAALGGDRFGATQVNLEPGPRPADIYSGVAKLVQEAIQVEADAGDPMAKVLVGKISRKVVKQTVMTNVYGVTFVGARAQVEKQLEAIMPNCSECDIPNYNLAAYVAKKIFKALATMFEGAHNIQYWLAECADRITRAITPEQIRLIANQKNGVAMPIDPNFKDEIWKYWAKKNAGTGDVKAVDFRTSVIWTTPLKLPVVQPYRSAKSEHVHTALQHVSFREPRAYDPVHRRRQLQAFPPNFVHSLDATHMLLSAIKCDEAGLTFAAVHDSFWTHAADVPVMSSVLREAFIKMHSDDIIGRLLSEFKVRYKGSLQLATVYVRSPLGQRIMALRKERQKMTNDSRVEWKGMKLSSKALQNELLEEWERQQLLLSETVKERVKGEAMKTPGALYSAVADPKDFQVPDEEPVALTPDEALAKAIEREMADGGMGGDELRAEETEKEVDDIEGEEVGSQLISKIAKRMNRKSVEQKIMVWAPLSFPEVPRKGDFDVSRLRESEYFFS